MTVPQISPTGLRLLDRRRFLNDSANGLSGLALATLLAQHGLTAEDRAPIRPKINPATPYASRPAHFAGRANRVLMIFCSGAMSHVDTFDYKPELVKRHDTPMPGSDKLITFQGENGNLIKPLWPFRPRGESGKIRAAAGRRGDRRKNPAQLRRQPPDLPTTDCHLLTEVCAT